MCVIIIVTIKGGHLMLLKGFPNHKELLLKERISFLWEQILSFKRSSILKRDAIEENYYLLQYSPFDGRNFPSVLATP